MKRGNSGVPSFKYKVGGRFFFFTLCQSSEYLQDALLTKLLGQFIKLDNTQILKD